MHLIFFVNDHSGVDDGNDHDCWYDNCMIYNKLMNDSVMNS
jgi:hypothetical protein